MRLVHYPVSDGDDEGGYAGGGAGGEGDADGAGDEGSADGDADDGGDGSETASSAGAEADGPRNVLATDVDLADSLLTQTRGLMFRRSLPDGAALAFRFDSAAVRDVHMLFVFFPIDAVWIVDGVVERVERLRPWRGFARAECDLLVELPAGAARGVEAGDRVVLEP